MNEQEAFSLLVKMLQDYQTRALYLPKMVGVHIKIFQLEFLIKEYVPEVHQRFLQVFIFSLSFFFFFSSFLFFSFLFCPFCSIVEFRLGLKLRCLLQVGLSQISLQSFQ